MERYVKILLYTYPLLKTVEKDYEECISNKALLSYGNGKSAEETAMEIAYEIVCQRKFSWLKETLKGVIDRLSEVERARVEVRYFGKKRTRLLEVCKEKSTGTLWSERKYFRRQAKAAEKVSAMFYGAGLTQERYLTEFVDMDIFRKIHRFVEEGKDKKISAEERRRMRG